MLDIYMEISSRQQGSFRASVAAEFLQEQQHADETDD
jgi:hypothetical protein